MDVRVGLWRRLSTEELMLLNLEKTLESPLDCKEIQPVHPKGNQPWVFLEGMMLKLKFQYFGYLMQRVDSLEKTLMLGGIGGRRRRGRQRMRWLDGIPTRWTWVWVNSGRWWWIGRPGVLWFTRSQKVGHDWATELSLTELMESKWKEGKRYFMQVKKQKNNGSYSYIWQSRHQI